MKRIINCILMISFLFFNGNCSLAQSEKNLINQKTFVAGQFYPADPEQLRNMLGQLFSTAKTKQGDEEVTGIISPHAGYIFSGKVAASAFNQVNPEKDYKTVFVIGSSHKMIYEGASVYNKGHFETPLGIVKVDIPLADKLISDHKVFNSKAEAFGKEHSIEVQLPFLQYHLKKDFQIIPILLGTHSVTDAKKIAQALLPYFNEENLFVFSADFSHYPEYATAIDIDKKTAFAIRSKSPEKFIQTINENTEKNTPGLLTSLCAWPSILCMLYLAEVTPEAEILAIDYMNSGDTEYGDKERVVGYNAMSIVLNNKSTIQQDSFSLAETDQKILLNIARNSIEYYLVNNKNDNIDTSGFSEIIQSPCGAFVTLNLNGNLRGCIGRMISTDKPLYQVVQEMAVSAAINDNRFEKVRLSEMKNIEIEISVLSPLKLISSTEEIELGKHGIYIKKGGLSGTFLPQVADHTGWSKEEFLGHCAQDKAGIGWNGWKTADIYTYEAFVFSEKEFHK